jgi:hypothetical protein
MPAGEYTEVTVVFKSSSKTTIRAGQTTVENVRMEVEDITAS